MRRARTLLLYARSVPAGLLRSLSDTIISRLHLSTSRLPDSIRRSRYAMWLEGYSSLSYVNDWRDAFAGSPRLSADLCNINDLLDMPRFMRRIRDYDLVVVLHSAAGDSMRQVRRATAALDSRRGPLVVFFGNEYAGMTEKIGFARDVGAEFIASQLPIESARWLYAACNPARVLASPAALNPTVYKTAEGPRTIDIGFRGVLYANPFALGDEERTGLLRFFVEGARSWDLVTDINFERYAATEWAAFLNRCRGVVGAESGTYYLERDDATRHAVIEYVGQHPNATFDEVFELFFARYSNPVSGKAISSRHFEPVGTKTCQILLEGDYNGILQADRDYISLSKDYSNIDDVVRRFRDDGYRSELVDHALEHVLAEHTYTHRVNRVLDEVL
ncbi:MAG: glycosyltransferase family 1 protein [Chloroflexi bacterium]|nr:MAG: glycosyltransferase family 1 protein [Chloroflexota bacterium]